jgi:NitT/TauT family transport system substrate-binding protein
MSRSRREFLAGAAALGVIAVSPGVSRAALSDPAEASVLFARLTPGPDYSFLWAAEALGYFEEEGLDVAIQPTGGSPEVARLLAAGQGDVGIPGAEATILSVSKGLPIKDVFCLQQRMIYGVGVPKGGAIETVEDLKGKRIGVQSLTASPVFVAKALLREAGLDPDGDVTFVPIGVGAQAVGAVKAGQVDAAAFHDTQFLLFEAGGVPFSLFPMPAFERYFTAGIAVPSDAIEDRPEMIAGFARAISKALVYTFANPEASIRAMESVVGKTNQDPELALAILKQRLSYMKPPPEAGGVWGWNTPERYGEFADFLLRAGFIDEEVDGAAIFDGRFLEEANAFDADAVSRAAKAA